MPETIIPTNVKLLLPLSGTNGGTSFPDLSGNNVTVTRVGTVTTSTSDYKYYGSSAYLNGGYLTVPAFAFGSSDFCFEVWFKRSAAETDCLIRQRDAGDMTGFEVSIETNNKIRFSPIPDLGTNLYSNSTISAGWNHVALTRASNVFRLFLNGHLEASYTKTFTVPQETPCYLGSNEGNHVFGPGYLQDIRVVIGQAVYTSNFTPPTQLYTPPANAYFSATDDIGNFEAFADVEVGPSIGYLFLDDTELLPLFALADPYVYRAWLSSNSDIGNLQALAYPVTQGFFDTTMTNDLGAFKAVGSVPVDEWASAGFPCPTRTRFSYIQGPGLVRTTFEAGNTWQRRRWTNNYRECEVGFRMPRDLLPAVETFLDARGYDWFQMGLTTGAYDQRASAPTRVRVKENPKLSGAGDGMFELTLTLEVDGTL